ncbi:MAG: serine hydrolase [Bryobacterales bacterium]|nr:serine hydrolase [Bryobacterales bacterium]
MVHTLLAVLVFSIAGSAQDLAPVQKALFNRVDESKKAVGIAVATLDREGQKFISRGKLSASSDQALSPDTVFEIGSITKAFTALLLADMIERSEVKAEDPVAKYLPDTVKVPSRGGKQITLLDLAMHVSGLPRLPNLKPADPENPYADYDAPKLYEFLSSHILRRDIGERYEYSNLGAGLLGHALARRAGMSYEQLLKQRILDPLGMKSTSITLSADQKKRLAVGHDPGLQPVKNWDLDVLAGAGAIRSTANDMMRFAAMCLELKPGPLQAAMRRSLAEKRPTGMPSMDIAMGWHIQKKFDSEIIWHNGGTGGYRSFFGFHPAKKQAVVVLVNTSFGGDDLGFHVLENRHALATYQQRKEVLVEQEILETYAGEYELAPTFRITVTREGSRLFIQATGQPKFEVFGESQTKFFLKVVEAQISFVKDDAGKVTSLILHQGGRDQKAPKVK